MQGERSCVACRTKRQPADLIRFVRTSPPRADLDLRGHLIGRGAYTCMSISCIERALSKGILARSLRMSISAEQAHRLQAEAKEYLLIRNG